MESKLRSLHVLAGIAVAYLRAAAHCLEVRRDQAAADDFARKALDVAATCLSTDPRSQDVSFFCGTPGYLALAAAANSFLGDGRSARSTLETILGWCNTALSHEEDELLFGRAGYLYALLWASSSCPRDASKLNFAEPLRAVAERLVATGRARAEKQYRDWPLMWHCFDKPYIGAAHGVVGILAMLFHCHRLLCAQSQQLVAATLQKLLSVRFPSGNLPIKLGERSDEHVHWCHGAPGLPAAMQAGEVVWQRGVILKGNGLCHGVTGNAYAFLTLYKSTGDAAHLGRAAAFASLLQNRGLQEAMSRQSDRQRQVPGVPDSPRSLMEGTAGVVCFLIDMAAPDKAVFPAWEF